MSGARSVLMALKKRSWAAKMCIFLTCKGYDHVKISKLLNRSYSSVRKLVNSISKELYFDSNSEFVSFLYESGYMTDHINDWFVEHPSDLELDDIKEGKIQCFSQPQEKKKDIVDTL
jgi:hypothetical protein